jgi:hypothetical protein
MFKTDLVVMYQNQYNMFGEKVGVALFGVPKDKTNLASQTVPDYYAFARDTADRPFVFKTLREARNFARDHNRTVVGQVPWQGE